MGEWEDGENIHPQPRFDVGHPNHLRRIHQMVVDVYRGKEGEDQVAEEEKVDQSVHSIPQPVILLNESQLIREDNEGVELG